MCSTLLSWSSGLGWWPALLPPLRAGDLMPVAVSAKAFALQAVIYFPHDIERPIAHLARVPNNVVSGEVNPNADEDRAAVRFGGRAGDGGEHCRQRQR